MTIESALQALEAAGTPQNRKIYARHGAREPMSGVSFANLGLMKKKLGTDHDLARLLWASGNYDARVLATMIADPIRATAAEVESWARDIDCHPLADLFAGYVARTPVAAQKTEAWTNSDEEFLAQAGWNLVARAAMTGGMDDVWCAAALKRIEAEIHGAKNRVRYAMNGALIAIGGQGGKWEKAALAASKRIGKVVVDHGETDCKTPGAAAYIAKVVAHAAKKKKK